MKTSVWWLGLRISLILIALAQSKFFLSSMDGDFSTYSLAFPLIMSSLCTIGVLFILRIQASSSYFRGGERWLKPSWRLNPFDFRQPLQFFHAAAFYSLSLALGCAVFGLSRTPPSWAWELPISTGLGLWFGVRLYPYNFRKKIDDRGREQT
jgi:hypothetical protein